MTSWPSIQSMEQAPLTEWKASTEVWGSSRISPLSEIFYRLCR